MARTNVPPSRREGPSAVHSGSPKQPLTTKEGARGTRVCRHRPTPSPFRGHESTGGELLSKVQIDNDPIALAQAVGAAGPEPEVVLEATFGWYRGMAARRGSLPNELVYGRVNGEWRQSRRRVPVVVVLHCSAEGVGVLPCADVDEAELRICRSGLMQRCAHKARLFLQDGVRSVP